MAGLGELVRAHKAQAMTKAEEVVSRSMEVFGDRLVRDWTPLGDPTLWKAPPPANYRPGNLQSSWFYSQNRPSSAATEATNSREIHNLDQVRTGPLGKVHYFSNNAPHALPIERGHSSQAPNGILWAAMEFEPIVRTLARSQA